MNLPEDKYVNYDDYIQSEAWVLKVADAKRRVNYRCQVCNRHEDDAILDGHHRTYDRLGREAPEDVTILCRDCHQLYETNKRLAKYGGKPTNYARSNPIGDLLPKADVSSLRQPVMLWGFSKLDEIIGPWRKGQLVVVSGRPGIGKSAFVNTIASNVAKRSILSVLFFSLQVPSTVVAARFLRFETGIRVSAILAGHIDDMELPIFLEAQDMIHAWPISLVDSLGLTPSTIRQESMKYARENELGLIVVDGGDLLCTDKESQNNDRDMQVVARELKALSMELGVQVVVTIPADQAVEKRADKRIVLTDILEPWVQYSDIVLALYREDYYIGDSDRAGVMDVMILKNRNDWTGNASLYHEAVWLAPMSRPKSDKNKVERKATTTSVFRQNVAQQAYNS